MIEPGQNNEFTNEDELTGTDLPHSDGVVSDEDVNKITDDGSGKPTGQDHSTENRENQAPTDGVGGVQSKSDTSSDIANLEN